MAITDINESQGHSPCINFCKIDEHEICLGCFRSLEEIGKWSTSSYAEKIAINESAALRKSLYGFQYKEKKASSLT